MVAREARQTRHTRARPSGLPLEGETVRLIAATSGGPKGGWPPAQRSWRPATRARAASRPVWLSAARSPAPRHRWTVWRGWPHRPPRRCPAIRSGSKPSRPVRARVSPGLHPATGATPRRACACATCVHPGLNRSHQKLLSLSSSSPSCGSRPLTGCLSEPGSAARRATGFPLDDLTFVVTHFLPHLNRDAVYRILKAEGLGRPPPADRPRRSHSRFKAYDLGFVHVDVKHLPKLRTQDGQSRKRYLYVAIDRASRFVHLAVK